MVSSYNRNNLCNLNSQSLWNYCFIGKVYMSLQDSNRYRDPICKECISYYDCLLDDKEDCQSWQEENGKGEIHND